MESRGSQPRALEQSPALGPRGFYQSLGLSLGSLDRAGGLPLGPEYPVDRMSDLRIGWTSFHSDPRLPGPTYGPRRGVGIRRIP